MKQLFLCAILFISISALGQKELVDKPSWRDRIYTGGGFGFNGGNFGGNKYFSFSVSPIVGYMITQQFSAGVGISYQRVSFPDINFAYEQYGFMPFLRYNFNDFFLTTEYNLFNLPNPNINSSSDRFYRSRWLVGAGYSQPLGQRARVNAIAMYDLLYQAPSYFTSPWVFRVFVSF
jgi:hypothetical protein